MEISQTGELKIGFSKPIIIPPFATASSSKSRNLQSFDKTINDAISIEVIDGDYAEVDKSIAKVTL